MHWKYDCIDTCKSLLLSTDLYLFAYIENVILNIGLYIFHVEVHILCYIGSVNHLIQHGKCTTLEIWGLETFRILQYISIVELWIDLRKSQFQQLVLAEMCVLLLVKPLAV